jgi:hypothetical protein
VPPLFLPSFPLRIPDRSYLFLLFFAWIPSIYHGFGGDAIESEKKVWSDFDSHDTIGESRSGNERRIVPWRFD